MSLDNQFGHHTFVFVGGQFQELTDEFGGRVQFQNHVDVLETHINSGAYSDRMFSWDSSKFDRCAKKVWGNSGQYFYSPQRTPAQIEEFLRLYFDQPELVLTKITHYTNQSNGYPVWFFGYHYPRDTK